MNNITTLQQVDTKVLLDIVTLARQLMICKGYALCWSFNIVIKNLIPNDYVVITHLFKQKYLNKHKPRVGCYDGGCWFPLSNIGLVYRLEIMEAIRKEILDEIYS